MLQRFHRGDVAVRRVYDFTLRIDDAHDLGEGAQACARVPNVLAANACLKQNVFAACLRNVRHEVLISCNAPRTPMMAFFAGDEPLDTVIVVALPSLFDLLPDSR